MPETQEYTRLHAQALEARQHWLEETELPRLKEGFRSLHMSFETIYQLLLKKGILQEDPYKQETKVGELAIPPTEALNESKKIDELSIRLSNYDNQIDFLVNFYQVSIEFLTIDRIKRIVGLVKYIDWAHFNNASPSHNTKALAELIGVEKGNIDQISMTIISESLDTLQKVAGTIMGILKELVNYQREYIKGRIRETISGSLDFAPDAGLSKKNEILTQIKKKYSAVGLPFSTEITEELINEDYTPQGKALKENILKGLALPEAKPKVRKQQLSFKAFLADGLHILSSVSQTIADIVVKIDENNAVMESTKKNFWDKVRKAFQEMMRKPPEPVIYRLQYLDPVKGTSTKEDVNYYTLKADLEKKIRTTAAMHARSGASRMDSMGEDQLLAFLERGVKEIQNTHKILSALDEYFKISAPPEVRDKIKGIKPELATIKNAIVNANQKRYEYSAQKEETEQLKKLGVDGYAQ
ncbi:MAG: hypothetical protein LBK64_07095 [Spirochaetaceae bacterium]|jgi:hypothetical protein|nr:hypothetical protein [Spirochaetaceae bacterium]